MCAVEDVVTFDKTRRELLILLDEILNDDEKLKAYAGKNAYLDCALLLLANEECLADKLDSYVSLNDLLNDISHTANGRNIIERRKELIRRNERL